MTRNHSGSKATTNKKSKKATKSVIDETAEEDDLIAGEPVKKKSRKSSAGKKKASLAVKVVEDSVTVVAEDRVQLIEAKSKQDAMQVISDDVEEEKEEDDGLDFLDDVKTPAVVRTKKTVAPSPFNEKIELERQLSEVICFINVREI